MIQQHVSKHFQLFGNREVTSLYFAVALVHFAIGLVSVFIPIFLWELGYPLWKILLFYAIENVYFVVAAFLSIPILRKLSDKSMLIASIPFFVGSALLLPFLEQYTWLFWVIPLIAVYKSIFFNTGYHLDFSGASDKKDLGKELGLRHMITSLVALAAPFIGGVIITQFNFKTVFFLSSCILSLALLPLLFFKKRKVSPQLTVKHLWKSVVNKQYWAHTISNIGYANSFIVHVVLWKLFLFLQIGNIEEFGGLISLSLLVSALVTFMAGSMTDHGKRKKILIITSIATAIIWFSRFFVSSALTASLSHLLFYLAFPALIVAWSTVFYRLAKQEKAPATFILGREVVTNLSRICFYLVLIPMAFYLDYELFFALSFVIAGGFTLLFISSNKQILNKIA